ncbi:TAXI family TRAP transporter solute-binding subunit [Synechocystis sp. CS-94]|uniref:TAXI family TRAP transporter solute-binding subunit n=1 Tax=Synechocystis sp. CS-94 TaxID=2847986 RepID=UPI00068E703F|nr:TAXI family TRAP transporter solute-binding subunit [Synechocystis sp. CS-94]MCT0253401.1 TAXI family TRAP transporter solute-binding subunit [Synechocystis sp. CS-94]
MAFIAIAPLVFVGCTTRRPTTVTLSSGSNISAYARIGEQIQASAATIDLVVEDEKDSQGSQQNLQRLLEEKVDFALVQLDVASEAMKAGDVAAVAILTEEYAHIVGRKSDNIKTLADLEGKKINIGPPASGINFTATRLFDSTNLQIRPFTDSGLGHSLQAFTNPNSGLDGLVYVGPLKASDEVREKLALVGDVTFVPLSESFINYLTLQFPESYRKAYIPQGTYRAFPPFPSEDILTISTGGALLTRPNVSREKVALMTWAIFANSRQFASFYPKLAADNGSVNLYEGLLYIHPAAMRTYRDGDPRIAWLRYIQENKPLQAASIMLISTTTIGFLLQGWRKRKTEKFLVGHRQAIADLRQAAEENPQEALKEIESLKQSYRLMLIEGNLAPDLYQQIEGMNEVFIEQCRMEINRQQDRDLNKIIGGLTEVQQWQGHNTPWMMEHLRQCQEIYREMLLKGHLDFPTYLNLYQMQLLLDILTSRPQPATERA